MFNLYTHFRELADTMPSEAPEDGDYNGKRFAIPLGA